MCISSVSIKSAIDAGIVSNFDKNEWNDLVFVGVCMYAHVCVYEKVLILQVKDKFAK